MSDQRAIKSRQRILTAANAIAVEQGARQLTLDNVAKQCGMSKGGVMHHFPNKNALLSGMLESIIGSMREETLAMESDTTDALPITTLLRGRQQQHENIHIQQAKLFLVAGVEAPDLLEPVQQMMVTRKERLKGQEYLQQQSLLLWLAMDGLSFQELLGITPFDQDERRAIRNKLIDIAVSLEGEKSE